MCEKNATNGACFKSPGCKALFDGKHCELCEIGYYKVGNLCQSCNCDINGGLSFRCDFNGKCDCKTGYSGDKCDSCKPGFYDEDRTEVDENVHCSECLCNISGSMKSDNATCKNIDPCPCSTDGVCIGQDIWEKNVICATWDILIVISSVTIPWSIALNASVTLRVP